MCEAKPWLVDGQNAFSSSATSDGSVSTRWELSSSTRQQDSCFKCIDVLSFLLFFFVFIRIVKPNNLIIIIVSNDSFLLFYFHFLDIVLQCSLN